MTQKRDNLGRFITDNPKTIIMRVTEEEKKIILKIRQIQNPELKRKDNFTQELMKLIRRRMNNLEF